MSLEKILEVLRKHKEDLKKKYGVVRIAIFGSRARGDYKDNSDLDVLVELEKPIGLFEFTHLAYEIEDLVGIPVDIATPAMINKPILKESVMEDLIYV